MNQQSDVVTCPKMSVGRIGEMAIENLLIKRDYAIVAKNMALYKGKKLGEIDILALKAETLYIVEARVSRTGWDRGDLFSQRKIMTLKILAAELYAQKQSLSAKRDAPESDPPLGTLPSDVIKAIQLAKRIKIILAEVRFSAGSRNCHIDFIPISSTF